MNKKIMKRALEEMKAAKMQVDSLEESLKKINPGFAKDTVRGSSPEFPFTEHPITIEGYSSAEREQLARELRRKQELWYRKIRIAERAIRETDPEMQNIIRRYYELDQTMEQIGDATGYTKGRISQKLKNFFEQ